MADNANSTNTKELPAFSVLKPYEQAAVVLRADGSTYLEVCNTINADFELSYKPRTVEEWFYAGGKLEQAYQEYNEEIATQRIKEAKQLIRKNSLKAARVIDEFMDKDKGHDPALRLRAAQTNLNKYIPDRQVVLGKESADDDLPEEIADKADNLVSGGEPNDGSANDTSKGEPAS